MFKQPPIEFTTLPFTQEIRLHGWALLLLVLAYLLPGSVGHMPWRGDDLLNIAASAGMLRDGQWLLPHIAGAPVFESPPLHYWLGAIFGKLLGWIMPLHDAIRLASVGAVFMALWLLRTAARSLLSHDRKGNASLLLAIGSIGLLLPAHEAQPQLTLFACLAGNLWGAALFSADSRRAALVSGACCGGAFLTAGLTGLALTLPAVLVGFGARTGRNDAEVVRHRSGVMHGLMLFAGLLLLWPIMLAVHDPLLLKLWWHRELLDITPRMDSERFSALVGLLGWFAWPLWPIAGWALWNRRKHLREAAYAIPLTALACALWIVVTTGAVRPANALPLLPPLVLLAASEVTRLRRGAVNWLDWFGIITFSLFGLFLWLAWSALHVGWPEALGRNVARLAPEFTPHAGIWTVMIASALSLLWLIALIRLPRFPLRASLHWALGITLSWGLLTTLWLDWFDYDRNYSRIMTRIAAEADANGSGCVLSLGTGGVQLAAFDYFTPLTVFGYTSGDPRCKLAVSYAAGRNGSTQEVGSGWTLLWKEDKGNGRFREQFALYKRVR